MGSVRGWRCGKDGFPPLWGGGQQLQGLRSYLDSAADDLLGVEVQTDRDISTVQKPQGVHVRVC